MGIYIVTPWFGVGSGGAERAAGWFAAAARSASLDAQVLATTLGNPFQGRKPDAFAAGDGTAEGIPVRRFRPATGDEEGLSDLRDRLERGERLSGEEEVAFFRRNVSSPDMEAFIHAHPDDLFVFIPYCYGTTVLGAMAARRFLLIPCLHDEAAARAPLLRTVFGRSDGIVFLSEPERDLFRRLYGTEAMRRERVTGLPAPEDPGTGGRASWSSRFPESRRFLFLGRKHRDKGVPELVAFFDRYVREHPDSGCTLDLAGPGEVEVQLSSETHIRDVGAIGEDEKWRLLAESSALIHPSTKESFCIAQMEAWACERPVLVNEQCPVTRWHSERANGGLWYADYPTFAACVNYLLRHPESAAAMGRQGRRYLEREYNPDKVRRSFIEFLREST